MSKSDQKRMNFLISKNQLDEMTQLITSLNTTQSDFIREALKKHIERLKKQRLEEELVEGYKAKAKLNLKICKDFRYVDGENI